MMKVMLDPGHGGIDPGAVGPGGTHESDVALAIAKKVAAYLPAPIEVLMTRQDDIDVGLYARPRMANEAEVSLFVSIHCNAAENRDAVGVETYALAVLGSDGARLAEAIQGRVVSLTGAVNRGVKAAGFAVLREANMPAALVEVGFISNYAEETKLKDAAYQDKIAKGIAGAVAGYFGLTLPEPAPSMKGKVVEEMASVWLNGNRLAKDAIIIEGTSYLPVRVIGEAMGLKVDWQPGRIDMTTK